MARVKARWLLINVETEETTFSDDDEKVEELLDDFEQDKYHIIDLAEGRYYESNGSDDDIREHNFDPPDEGEDEPEPEVEED